MKNNIIFSLILLLSSVTYAQQSGHYLKFDIGGGQHSINYSPENGVMKPGLGATGNIAYNYFFAPNWGIGTGLGIQTFQSTATLNFMSTTPSVDTDGDSYDYRAYYSNWQERQRMLMLDIPIALNYRHLFGTKLGLLASAGTKISLPLRSDYKSMGGDITTTGYYPQWDIELNGMPQHGFDTYNEFAESGLNTKVNLSAFVDLGALYKISEKVDLYIGAYANYGLTDVSGAGNHDVYQVSENTYHGVLASNQISKASLLSVGLKVGINLQLSKSRSHEVLPVQQQIEQTPSETAIIPDPVAEQQFDPIADEPADTVTIIVEEEEIDWKAIASQKASQIELHFKKDSSTPTNNQDASIVELSKILTSNQNINLLIIGHTCNLGSKEINQRVGLRRANSVKEALIEKGIPAERITTESRDYTEPLVPNTSEANRSKNRRAEVKIAE